MISRSPISTIWTWLESKDEDFEIIILGLAWWLCVKDKGLIEVIAIWIGVILFMTLAEALLAADAGQIKKRATKDVEVKRLSEKFGVPFILHLRELSLRRAEELAKMATKEVDGKEQVNKNELALLFVTEGITNKEFYAQDVLKHYGVASRKDLFEELFNIGEIQEIYSHIDKLSGGKGKGEHGVEEIKN